jgi:hypothetical protein
MTRQSDLGETKVRAGAIAVPLPDTRNGKLKITGEVRCHCEVEGGPIRCVLLGKTPPTFVDDGKTKITGEVRCHREGQGGPIRCVLLGKTPPSFVDVRVNRGTGS